MSRFMTILLPSLSRGQSFPRLSRSWNMPWAVVLLRKLFFLLYNMIPDMGLYSQSV